MDEVSNTAVCGDHGEHAVGRFDQLHREGAARGLAAVEQAVERSSRSTAASFHARWIASPMPALMPWPSAGLRTWAASPTRLCGFGWFACDEKSGLPPHHREA
jgi:hypothetical protein